MGALTVSGHRPGTPARWSFLIGLVSLVGVVIPGLGLGLAEAVADSDVARTVVASTVVGQKAPANSDVASTMVGQKAFADSAQIPAETGLAPALPADLALPADDEIPRTVSGEDASPAGTGGSPASGSPGWLPEAGSMATIGQLMAALLLFAMGLGSFAIRLRLLPDSNSLPTG